MVELRNLGCAEHERRDRPATRGVDRHRSSRGVVHDEIGSGLAVQRQGGDVHAEVRDVVGLRAECQCPYPGVSAIGPDHHVEPPRRTRRELCRHAVGVLLEIGHRVAELEFHLVGDRRAQNRCEIAAWQLDIARLGPCVHGGAAHDAAAGVDEHHVAHLRARVADLRHDAHPLGDVLRGPRTSTGLPLDRMPRASSTTVT